MSLHFFLLVLQYLRHEEDIMIIKPKKNEHPKVTIKKVKPRKVSDDATRVYHVAKREDGKWQVKFAGGEKAIKLFKTQKEALEYSKEMAKKQKGTMLVHNSKGKNKGKIKSK